MDLRSPFGFMSNALRWLPELRAGDVVHEPFADVPIAVIDPYDIADVVAVALRRPGHDSTAYLFSGHQGARGCVPLTWALRLGRSATRPLGLWSDEFGRP